MKTITIRLRIEPEFKEQLIKAIKEGKAESLSALIRAALKKFLEGDSP
jgi:Arc/MetJ-type ribon-helix-helix transcriptional regulator